MDPADKSIESDSSLPDIERTLVVETYNKQAEQFKRSRYSRWSRVELFVNSRPNGKFLDVGCGGGNSMFNRKKDDGRYISERYRDIADKFDEYPIHEWYGCDLSNELVKLCVADGLNVVVSDMCKLPYADNSFDSVMSIAVFHHLSTHERRITALKELIRVTKPGGHILLSMLRDTYGLSKKDKKLTDVDVSITFNGCDRYYHLFKMFEFERLLEEAGGATIEVITIENSNWYYELVKLAQF